MGKMEILMVIAAIIMSLAFGLVAGPSINQSINIPKYSVYNSEIENIRNVAVLWIADNKTDGISTGITSDVLESYSRLTKNASGYLESKINSNSGYTITSPDPHQIQITLQGISLTGAEASVKIAQSQNAISIVDTDPNDGVLVFTFNI